MFNTQGCQGSGFHGRFNGHSATGAFIKAQDFGGTEAQETAHKVQGGAGQPVHQNALGIPFFGYKMLQVIRLNLFLDVLMHLTVFTPKVSSYQRKLCLSHFLLFG